MKILFPYMARWKAVNWTRYHSLFSALAEMGHEVIVLQTPPSDIKETNFQEIEVTTAGYVSFITPGVLWELKVNARVFPFEIAGMVEGFIGIKARF